MKSHLDIIRDTIRLAKFWDKKIDERWPEMGYYSGRSAIIEAVVIYANRGRKKRSVLTCFTRFLLEMEFFNSLEILPTKHFAIQAIPGSVRKQRPLILDPTNPKNNLSYSLTPFQIETLEDAAWYTLTEIENLECVENADTLFSFSDCY